MEDKIKEFEEAMKKIEEGRSKFLAEIEKGKKMNEELQKELDSL